jgi:hypothetical protein
MVALPGSYAAAYDDVALRLVTSKTVDERIGLSTPSPEDSGGVVVSSDGQEIPIKFNPAIGANEWTVDGKTVQANYGRKTLTVNFSDLANLSGASRSAIVYLAERGVIKGMSATAFGPKDSITRAQFTQLVVSAINRLNPNADGNFSDIKKGDWMRAGVGSGKNIGIISGNPDGTFKPNNTITKEQIIAISARTLVMEVPKLKTSIYSIADLGVFLDSSSIPEWARGDVALALKAELFARAKSGKFNAGADMTREDAAFIIRRLFDRLWL